MAARLGDVEIVSLVEYDRCVTCDGLIREERKHQHRYTATCSQQCLRRHYYLLEQRRTGCTIEQAARSLQEAIEDRRAPDHRYI